MSISVVIPAYNASRFLAETLESVLRQTLPADEILVIDDGSTDNTAAIAESFGPPVRVFRRPNSRQGASRNFGVQQASSEWIAFIDADDLWKENKLERQMEELAKHPKADICYTGNLTFSISDEGKVYRPPVPGCPPERIRRELLKRNNILPSSVMIRRSTLLANGGFATNFKISEDWDLWLRLLHAGTKFACCPEPLLLYRMHGNNVSSNSMIVSSERLSIIHNHVLPHLSGPQRWATHAKAVSAYKVNIAYSLREQGDPSGLRTMTASILQWPFGDPVRYKVWLHMLLTRLKLIPAKH